MRPCVNWCGNDAFDRNQGETGGFWPTWRGNVF